MAALAPAALGAAGPVGDLLVWTAVTAMAAASGRSGAVVRSRPDVAVPDPWGPSRRVGWTAALAARITAWPRVDGDGWRAPARILAVGDTLRSAVGVRPRPGQGILLRGKGAAPRLWSTLSGCVDGQAPARAALPGGFSYADFLFGRGLHWIGRLDPDSVHSGSDDLLRHLGGGVFDPLRRGLIGRLDRSLPRREALLARSVLLGDRGPEIRSQKEPFTRLGLAHLFAVSGLHVGILVGVLLGALALVPCGPCARFRVVAALLPVYVVLTGMAGSTVRAAGLTLLILAGAVFGRAGNSLRALGLLFWMSMVWQPAAVGDSGLRLSYLAAAGIVSVLRHATPAVEGRPRAVRWAAAGLAVSLGAQWFTLPELARSFGWVSLTAPAVNLAAVPLFGFAVSLMAGALAAGVLSSWAAGAIWAWAWLLLRGLEAGASLLAVRMPPPLGLPPWTAPRTSAFLVLSFVILAALGGRFACRRRLRRVVAAAAILLMVALLPAGRFMRGGGMKAVQFAVGQGDAALLGFPDGLAVLVDAGDGEAGASVLGRDILAWFDRQGLRRVGTAVLTHGHDDHTGGAADLAARVAVGRWDLGGRAAAPESTGTLRRPRAGDVVHASGDWRLVYLHSDAEEPPDADENDRSLVLGLYRRDRLVGVWAGDLESGGEARLLAGGRLDGAAGIQVLKAGHHGSATSSSPPFLAALLPSLTLVSCGVENRHRHPSHGPFVAAGDTLRILRSDRDGTVLMAWDEAGALHWRTSRGASGSIPGPPP